MTYWHCGSRMTESLRDHLYSSSPRATLIGAMVRECPSCGDRELSLTAPEEVDRALAQAIAAQPQTPAHRAEYLIEVDSRTVHTILYARDGETGAWTAELAETPQVHTHGPSLEEARERIREALGAWVGED